MLQLNNDDLYSVNKETNEHTSQLVMYTGQPEDPQQQPQQPQPNMLATSSNAVNAANVQHAAPSMDQITLLRVRVFVCLLCFFLLFITIKRVIELLLSRMSVKTTEGGPQVLMVVYPLSIFLFARADLYLML